MDRYNEVFDESGQKRKAYAAIESRVGRDLANPSRAVVVALGNCGESCERAVFPVPLVMDDREFREVLVPGVVQRAFALQELFADLAIGGERITKSGMLDAVDLTRILESECVGRDELRRMWHRQTPEQIRFVYGPDLVRSPSGRWVVLEDNIGCLGGIADRSLVLDRFLAAANIDLHPELPHDTGLREMLLAFLRHVNLRADSAVGIPGPTISCGGGDTDVETKWKQDALLSVGIAVAQPEQMLAASAAGQTAIIINLSSTQAQPYRELCSQVFAGRTSPIFGGPLIGAVASKCFHALGDELVTLFVSEPSLLDVPDTRLIRERLGELPSKGIVKRANGCGGTEVFFLDTHTSPPERYAIAQRVRSWGPCEAVVQQPVSHSILAPACGREAGYDVDVFVEIRPIVYVLGWRSAMVDDTISGRAIRREEGRLGNISRGAQHLAVLREKTSDGA